MNMKYIIMETSAGESPIIFPAWMNHSDIARDLPGKAVSAGELRIIPLDQNDDTATIVANKFEVDCFGRSTSLKLTSRAEDAKIIWSMMHSPLR